jgi:hypothetical protein
MQLAEQYATLNELSNPADIGLAVYDYSATSVIGPEGGVVRVTDPQSTIFGTCLKVPPGALDIPVRISIIAGDHTCSFGFSPSIKLLPSGLRFKRFATLKVCLNDICITTLNDLKTVEPALFHYDETTDQWAHNDAVRLDLQGNAVLCDLLHL